jgi:hypothetical protein
VNAGSNLSSRQQFEQMSIDELLALHKDVDQILAARLIAKKEELERRLEQLRQNIGPGDWAQPFPGLPWPSAIERGRQLTRPYF